MAASEGFQLITECKLNAVIPVYKYKSLNTGMTVVLAQVEGPLVNGYFCLATEAHDDDGLPHTLEHLIFMGSEEYPYKGVLDLLANRSLASGTNAWTDTDHTCYTMTNAGSQGFLNLMPVYLDHVIYPTLTEAAYLTEVHHVNGEGEDAGVVYCEMQARENSGESRTHLAMLRAMYPGHCGYKSETGGMMANLRDSTSHQKVCDYHRQFYRPENLCLIITGQLSPEQVFTALKPVEEKIMKKGERGPYTRPWQTPIPPLTASVDQVIKYASDDEDHGMVTIAWRGPSGQDHKGLQSLMVLTDYLSDTSISPLQRDFVEVEDPYCSQVRVSLIENKESCVFVSFENVPSAKIPEIKDKLLTLLKKIATKEEEIDMKRMHDVIHRNELETMSRIEDGPHDMLAFMAIADFLNSDSTDEMEMRLNPLSMLKQLDTETADFWTSILNNYMVDKPYVNITGEPSKTLREETGASEKDRVTKQREALGEEGLKKCAESLTKATQENEKEPPESMLTSVPVPSVDSIKFHPLQPASNFLPDDDNNSNFSLHDMQTDFQLDDIQTNFATMMVTMDSSEVPKQLGLYMPLLLEVLLESSVQRDEVLVPYDQVIRELAADTLSNNSTLGIGGRKFACGSVSDRASLYLRVEKEKYSRGVSWIKELLYQTKFSAERLKIVANRMINEVAELKRNGRFVVQSLMKGMVYKKESNHHTVSVLRQHKFLSAVVKKVENGAESEAVINDLEKLRSLLTQSSKIRVHLAANVESLEDPASPWKQDVFPKDSSQKEDKVRSGTKLDRDYLYSQDEGPGQGFVVGVGSVESSFFIQTAPGITDPMDPDLPALNVFIQYLTQLEGPMWRQVRGLGLSYHYSMYTNVDAGTIQFILFKSTHVYAAYKVAKDIVDGFLNGTSAFSEVEFESCKSSLIFEIIEEEKTPSAASHQSVLATYRGIPQSYNRHLIKQIPNVTLDDLRRVGPKYIAPLFDVATSKCAVVCHPSKVGEVVQGFKQFSRPLTVIESIDDSFLSSLDV